MKDTRNYRNLYSLFRELQLVYERQLEFCREVFDHPVLKGNASENFWMSFLRKHLPSIYGVAQGKVIDHFGALSRQIDIIIYDNLLSPYIINYSSTVYIPIECVYCVIEVKQEFSKKNVMDAVEKVSSVRKLKSAFVRLSDGMPVQSLDFPIIGGIATLEYNKTNSKKKSLSKRDKIRYETILSNLERDQILDLGCSMKDCSFYVKYGDGNLPYHQNPVGKNPEVKFFDASNSLPLLTFLYQLIRLLEKMRKANADYSIDIDQYLNAFNAGVDASFTSTSLF